MIEALHTGMMANVSVGGEVSESFSVTNGVKEGCVLAPTLFSIFLSAMFDDAFRDMVDGVYIQSRQSADLFNVAHFRAKTKSTRILMRELLFADDSALVAHSAEEMHNIVDTFSNASKKFGLKINIKKTEVLYQPNSTRTREEDIMVDGNKLNSVLELTYLGSTISSDGCIDDEIQRRMAKASASFEAWTVYRRQVKKLHAFMMRHLRSIMRITWMDKVTNKEILERTGLPSMEDLLIRKNLRWTGHQTGYRSRFSNPNCLLVREREAPSSPVQGYHQEKPEAERHKDRLLDVTLTAERQMESNSQVMEAVFVASRPTA